jgi:hypothetical protein
MDVLCTKSDHIYCNIKKGSWLQIVSLLETLLIKQFLRNTIEAHDITQIFEPSDITQILEPDDIHIHCLVQWTLAVYSDWCLLQLMSQHLDTHTHHHPASAVGIHPATHEKNMFCSIQSEFSTCNILKSWHKQISELRNPH